MTKHRDVNKCRPKEKCKMAALIRQANSGYEMANKPQIKKKEDIVEEKKQINKLSKLRKRRQEMSASNVTKAGYT